MEGCHTRVRHSGERKRRAFRSWPCPAQFDVDEQLRADAEHIAERDEQCVVEVEHPLAIPVLEHRDDVVQPVAVAMLPGHHRLADGLRDPLHALLAGQPDVLDQGVALALFDRQRHPMAGDRHPVLVVALIEFHPGIDHVNVGAESP